jgi:hypothetical protein
MSARWLLVCVGAAAVASHAASVWAPHLTSGERAPWPLSVLLCAWLWRHARLTPPSDPLSRLRAPFEERGRKVTLAVSALLACGLIALTLRALTAPTPTLSVERVLSYAPMPARAYLISGTPKVEDPPYRWALDEAARDGVEGEEGLIDDEAPYLTPVEEFKGQVLIVSVEPITAPFSALRGRLLSTSEAAQVSFISYRNYIGLSRKAPIYLLDARARWWFDPTLWSACLWALTLVMGVWSSATRDPENEHRGLYIPPDLRG